MCDRQLVPPPGEGTPPPTPPVGWFGGGKLGGLGRWEAKTRCENGKFILMIDRTLIFEVKVLGVKTLFFYRKSQWFLTKKVLPHPPHCGYGGLELTCVS